MSKPLHPWLLMHSQDALRRRRGRNPWRRCELSAMTTQLPPGSVHCQTRVPLLDTLTFAKPRFPFSVSCCEKHCQACFCFYTLRRISDSPEQTFGRPWYFFRGVPPQSNYPSHGVPLCERWATWFSKDGVTLTLHTPWRECFDAPIYAAHKKSGHTMRL